MRGHTEVQRIISQIVERLVRDYAPRKVILFGSHASGTSREDSDIDLLIIKDTEKRPIERWMEVKRLLRDPDRPVAVSPLVYTPGELEERLRLKDFFLQEVLAQGEVLYG